MNVSDTHDEKFSRTLVVGGFQRDTPKKDIIKHMEKHLLKVAEHVDEAFAYNVGSIGVIRFHSRHNMFEFNKSFNSKERPASGLSGSQHQNHQKNE